MKLTGELKDKVDKTESMEEKKDIIAQAGMELTDNELEMVAGGDGDSREGFDEYIRKRREEIIKELEKDTKEHELEKRKRREEIIKEFEKDTLKRRELERKMRE